MDKRQNRLIALLAIGFVAVVGFALSRPDRVCADITQILLDAEGGFHAIRGEAIDGHTWTTKQTLPNATSCSVTEEPSSALYQCVWEYALTSGAGPAAYQARVAEVRSCLGFDLPIAVDNSVNHPDFWASTTLTAPSGQIIVSLKNKGAIGRTLVTISIAG